MATSRLKFFLPHFPSDLFHTSDSVDGDLSPYRRTYFPYHLWKRTLSTVLDIIAVWVLRELKKKGGGEKSVDAWVHSVIYDRQDEMSFRTIFEDPRRDEAKFFLIILEYMDYFEELHETVE